VRGTLRHFIAKMTFFNVCHKTRTTVPGQSEDEAIEMRRRTPTIHTVTPITFIYGFSVH